MVAIKSKPAKKMLESEVLTLVRERLALMRGVKVFRNNVGMLRDSRGVPVRYGLATGSCDLIGSVTIDVKGIRVAISLAIEVKRPGERPSEEQHAWMDMARSAGWIVGWVDNPHDAAKIVQERVDSILWELSK